ncbi:LAMI_0F07602g1_1 [Lachancea mirantina]|uniref:LAMI_0F07602g1_1 n=1 Tax=Lachancea mirantina TaxID=1230905 RepID=A0A1G4JZZ2_9SACH|nr:LAMI_0F07602g1_1 [Lachancea mirantina]
MRATGDISLGAPVEAPSQSDGARALGPKVGACVLAGGGRSRIYHQNQGSAEIRKLQNFKETGRVIRHIRPEAPKFLYNAFNREENPCNTMYDSAQAQISLELDNDCFYLPGLRFDEKTLMQQHSSFQNAALRESHTAVTGRVRVIVKQKRGFLFQTLCVRLSCYSAQFMYTRSPFTGNMLQTLSRDKKSGLFKHYWPTIQDVIHFGSDRKAVEDNKNSGDLNGLTFLEQGTYDFIFSFNLDANSFLASVNTHCGSNVYRAEACVTVPKARRKFETIFMSSEFQVRKTMLPKLIPYFESAMSHNFWESGMLESEFVLGSRLIEFDTPFQLSLQLLRQRLDFCKIMTVDIILQQTISFPLENGEGYHEKQMGKILASVTDLDQTQMCHSLTFDNLIAKQCFGGTTADSKFFPYHFELGPLKDAQGNPCHSLKISHEVRARVKVVTMRPNGQAVKAQYILSVPVVLLDADMNHSSYLPRYEPKQINDIGDAGNQSLGGLDSFVPPAYSELPAYSSIIQTN